MAIKVFIDENMNKAFSLKQSELVLDVMTREGIEFSTRQIHCMFTTMVENYDFYEDWLNDLCATKHVTQDERLKKAYQVLFWGCGRLYTKTTIYEFAEYTKDYYNYIGALDFYKGVINEGLSIARRRTKNSNI